MTGRMAPDRWVMITFAVLELIALIWGIVEIAVAMGRVRSYADDAHVSVTHADHGPSSRDPIKHPVTFHVNPRERLLVMTGWGIALVSIALVSLLAVSAYYTLGKMLQHRHLVPAHHMARGWSGGCGVALKLLNITIGALGIVTISAAVALTACAGWYSDHVPWKNAAERKSASDELMAATALSLVALVLKLAEALLGHYWAIDLTKHRCNEMIVARGDPSAYATMKM